MDYAKHLLYEDGRSRITLWCFDDTRRLRFESMFHASVNEVIKGLIIPFGRCRKHPTYFEWRISTSTRIQLRDVRNGIGFESPEENYSSRVYISRSQQEVPEDDRSVIDIYSDIIKQAGSEGDKEYASHVEASLWNSMTKLGTLARQARKSE